MFASNLETGFDFWILESIDWVCDNIYRGDNLGDNRDNNLTYSASGDKDYTLEYYGITKKNDSLGLG